MCKKLWGSFKGFSDEKEFLNTEKNITEEFDKEGKCNLNEINFNDIVFLYKSDYLLKNEIKQDSTHKIDGIAFTLGLEGEMKLKSHITEEQFSSKKSYINLHLISQDCIYHEISKNSSYKALSFILKKDFLQKILPEDNFKEYVFNALEKNSFNEILYNSLMDIKMSFLANEIYKSPMIGKLDQLYLESKTLEVIYHCLNTFSQSKSDKDLSGIKFSQYDINALNKAKKILLENMHKPPSIEELSKIVKLNDFKLQFGFKIFFNLTPYSFLLEERMQKAKILLKESEYNINEIALLVGYSYAQNFSNAFLKRFGIRPKEIMKTRKYYY
ncbi:helix-turn-helix domain-containing protein [Malaciobacter marinus]|uniref:helix-turn-helix domain-containing protein n=1 Tax=Malaciobacter marinus TaxID=505249 RepID=UPI003B0076E5